MVKLLTFFFAEAKVRALEVNNLFVQSILVNFSLVDLRAKFWFFRLLLKTIFSYEICLDVFENLGLSFIFTGFVRILHIMLHLVGCLIAHVWSCNMEVCLG